MAFLLVFRHLLIPCSGSEIYGTRKALVRDSVDGLLVMIYA